MDNPDWPRRVGLELNELLATEVLAHLPLRRLLLAKEAIRKVIVDMHKQDREDVASTTEDKL
eukprot:8109242-Heterocapsa_arctica.AAC.1